MNPTIHFKTQCLLCIISIFCIAGCASPTTNSDTTSATAQAKYTGPTNKDVYNAINAGNMAKLDSLIAKDAVDHTTMGDIHGLDSIKTAIKEMMTAFPDVHLEAIDEAVEGDMILTRYRMTATNKGKMGDMPATNKKVDMMGVDVAKSKDGKIVEHWQYSDNLEFYKQLGINPMAAPEPKK